MKRLLFCWQLGANYGHLGQDLPVAQALRERGAEVFFAVPDLRLAAQWLEPRGFTYVMAPQPAEASIVPFPLGNYAEILLTVGFADELMLTGLVHGWCRLLELVRPDGVILDYAPMALVAARLLNIPALQLSTGFDVPPAVTPLPAILPEAAAPSVRLRSAEALVAKKIRGLFTTDGQARYSSIQELLTSAPTLFATFPELDHYGARAGAEYIGPILSEAPGAAIDWPVGPRRRILAYLRPSIPGVAALLAALAACDASIVCAMPGAAPELLNRYASATFRLLPHAVPLAPLLASAGLMVSYGGLGTTCAALLAGVPLLMVPQLVEQQLIGQRVCAIGAGQMLLNARSQTDCARALKDLLVQGGPREAARAFSRAHAAYQVAHAVERAVAAIDSLLDKCARS